MARNFFTFSGWRAPLLLCAAAAAVGTGLGWLGRAAQVGARPDTSNPLATDVSGSMVTTTAAGKNRFAPDERKAEALALKLASDKGVKYWLRLLAAAETAPSPLLAKLTSSLENEPAALSLLGTRWAQLDPGGMFSALKTRAAETRFWSSGARLDPGFAKLQQILVGEWFRQNPEALITALADTKALFRLKPAKDQLLTLLAATDPEKCLHLSLAWQTPIPVQDTTVLISWARNNALKAAEILMATNGQYLTTKDARRDMLDEAAKVLAETAPEKTLARFTDLGDSAQQGLVVRIVKAWAARDLTAAVAWFSAGHVSRVNTTEQVTPFLEVWGAVDPAAAMDWAEMHLTGSPKDAVASTIIQSIAAQDTARAVEFVSQLPSGNAKYEAMRKLTNISVKHKTKPELEAAFQWMMAMPDPAMRRIAMDSGAPEITKAAPEVVRAYLESPAGAEAPVSLLVNAAHVQSLKDGPAAIEWASGLRPDVAAKVRWAALGTWLGRDPVAAADWVTRQPAGDDRATDVAAITLNMANRKGEDGLNTWLATLPASDHAAIRAGLAKAWELEPAVKARLEAKYR